MFIVNLLFYLLFQKEDSYGEEGMQLLLFLVTVQPGIKMERSKNATIPCVRAHAK